jgi:glycosyltransferase involved in cell wall biosynthesis
MRFQVLVTDAFGGQGGIAKFNRDLLTALCSHPDCAGVTAFPRLMPNLPGPLPEKLAYVTEGLNSKIRYAQCVMKKSFSRPKADLLICGHINLLPLARLIQFINRAPPTLIIHGIDAWQPTRSRLANRCARRIETFLSVSDFTKQRFLSWTGLRPEQGYILPDSITLEDFGPGVPDGRLLDRYRLHGRKVILTLGRLSSQERYKGIDEVMEVLPTLAGDIPNLTWLIAGDGTDRARLEEKAAALRIKDRVVFAGYIPEAEKADHYRLADAFVMPGWGEGFGIVYLEAMACGIPVVASKLDASREAVRNGELGILADPKNPRELRAGILEALRRPKGTVPGGLAYFSSANFRQRCHAIVDKLMENRN